MENEFFARNIKLYYFYKSFSLFVKTALKNAVMKPIKFVFVCVLLFSIKLQAQQAQQALQGDEFWAYSKDYRYPVPPGGCEVDSWNFYELKGDTSFSGKTWFKLFASKYQHTICQSPFSENTSYAVPTLTGFIHEDSGAWYFQKVQTSEVNLLYDFKLSLGSKFFQNDSCKVELMDTITGSTTRAVFGQIPPLSNSYATSFIEGIGAQYSYLTEPACFSCYGAGCVSATVLRCFKQKGKNEFSHAQNDCSIAQLAFQKVLDQQITAIENPEDLVLNAENVFIVPNPGNQFFSIDLTDFTIAGTLEISVFDTWGHLLERKNHHYGRIDFDASLWPKGVYYIKIAEKGKTKNLWKKWIRL